MNTLPPTPLSPRSILSSPVTRIVDRFNQTLARFASFTLEDWMDEVCDPIIQDLRGSQSYRASGLDARHRFGREQSIPPLKRCVCSTSVGVGARPRGSLTVPPVKEAFRSTTILEIGCLSQPPLGGRLSPPPLAGPVLPSLMLTLWVYAYTGWPPSGGNPVSAPKANVGTFPSRKQQLFSRTIKKKQVHQRRALPGVHRLAPRRSPGEGTAACVRQHGGGDAG